MLVNLLKFKPQRYSFPTIRRAFSILDPNSLVFNHKKDLDRLQKQITRMKNPGNFDEIQITSEMDFEPGVEYFGGFSKDTHITVKASPIDTKISTTTDLSSPENGFVQFQIPFHKDPKLKDSYKLLHTSRMRYGKLLEILDYLSAFSAYRHNHIYPKSKIATMVTASVDQIALFKHINLNKQLSINAYPTWTGETSLEIRIDLYNGDMTEGSAFENDDTFLGSAFFVYVMRDALNYGKKKKVRSLDPSALTDPGERHKAMLRTEIGSENKKARFMRSQKSLFKSPPTQEESEILHNQFVLYKAKKKFDDKLKHCANVPYETMKETRVEKSILMHSQNMNVNGHVFGGYVMREALELGYVCAYLHANKESPTVICVDSVAFHKPVVVGSVAQFVAEVCLAHENLIHVCVEVFNFVEGQETPVLTTTINITYQTQHSTPEVYPTTYECGVKFLDAKRKVQSLFDFF
jgi:acyl-coenzyme A thioesterase 9